MKQLGDVLKTIISKNILEAAQEHNRLYNSWNTIVEEAFTNKRYISKNINNSNVLNADIYISNEYRELINARVAADHSSVKYVKNNVLYIETDHQGWIQILQTKQHNIMQIVNKRFPELHINGIAFVLRDFGVNETISGKAPVCTENIPDDNPGKPDSADINNLETALSGIKDEEFKNLLRKLGEKVKNSNRG
jgi:hypothetical protein